MRYRDDRDSRDQQTVMARVGQELEALRLAIASQEASIAGLIQNVDQTRRAGDETHNAFSDVGRTFNGETRFIREQLVQLTRQMESIDARVTAIEGHNSGLLALMDARLRAIAAQVTSAVAAVVVIVLVAGVMLVFFR